MYIIQYKSRLLLAYSFVYSGLSEYVLEKVVLSVSRDLDQKEFMLQC